MPLNNESADKLMALNRGPTGLPGHSWSYHIEEIVNRLVGIYQEWTGSGNNAPITKVTTDKNVEERVQEVKETVHKEIKIKKGPFEGDRFKSTDKGDSLIRLTPEGDTGYYPIENGKIWLKEGVIKKRKE